MKTLQISALVASLFVAADVFAANAAAGAQPAAQPAPQAAPVVDNKQAPAAQPAAVPAVPEKALNELYAEASKLRDEATKAGANVSDKQAADAFKAEAAFRAANEKAGVWNKYSSMASRNKAATAGI